MNTSDFLDRLLIRYMNSYDIIIPYTSDIPGCTAYGKFASRSEKYVLTRKANIWTVLGFEHVFFLEVKELAPDLTEEIGSIVTDELEPQLVRSGNKYPPKDHMYTFLTFVVLCGKKPEKNAVASLKKFRLRREYLLGFRGSFETHFICVDTETENITMNFRDPELKKIYIATFDDVKKGKPGYGSIAHNSDSSCQS